MDHFAGTARAWNGSFYSGQGIPTKIKETDTLVFYEVGQMSTDTLVFHVQEKQSQATVQKNISIHVSCTFKDGFT